MTQSTSFRSRCIPVFSLLALCTAAAQAQTPTTLPEALPAPVLFTAAAHEISVASGWQLSENAGASSSTPGQGIVEPETSTATLPDAPSALDLPAEPTAAAFAPNAPGQAAPNVAPRLTKYIPSGMTAQSITGRDKVLIGLRDLYSPLDFLAMIASAGYEQVVNGQPNYGTDKGAFGQRLGAAAIRETTQGFFTDSVFSPILHEDPRYYVQGPGHNFFYRTAYAATRVVVTKTDSGKNSVNGAMLLGYASSAALTYTYYPPINQNFHDIASNYGGSLGGAALGFFVSEFSDDLLKAVHLKK